MTTTTLSKIYEKMPVRTLAAMAVNAEAANDSAAVDRIMAAVPRRNYIAPDANFEWTKDALTTVLLGLACEWWRTTAMWQTTRCGSLMTINDSDNDESFVWNAHSQKWTRRLKVVDAVIHAICSESGLDEATIRKWLHLLPEEIHAELDDEQQTQFDDMIGRWRQSTLG